jgi:hypothetical protein
MTPSSLQPLVVLVAQVVPWLLPPPPLLLKATPLPSCPLKVVEWLD